MARDLSSADKAERVKKILRDYQEIQAKMSADYAAAGSAFPGGLGAFLRQLALLESEKHNDLGKVLTPRELEDFEIRANAAGQKMRTLLDGTAATDEQRRAVFRVEQQFNTDFGLTFDLSPAALRTREVARQSTQEEIRATLGDGLFGTWLQRDDPGYAGMVQFVRQQNLTEAAALALWQAKNEYLVKKLEIEAQPDDTTEARRSEALQVARAKVIAIVGPAAMESANSEVVDWLRQAPAKNLPVK